MGNIERIIKLEENKIVIYEKIEKKSEKKYIINKSLEVDAFMCENEEKETEKITKLLNKLKNFLNDLEL